MVLLQKDIKRIRRELWLCGRARAAKWGGLRTHWVSPYAGSKASNPCLKVLSSAVFSQKRNINFYLPKPLYTISSHMYTIGSHATACQKGTGSTAPAVQRLQ